MLKINRRLSEEPDWRRELAESTEGYLRARDALEELDSGGHPGGGPERVKCLHAHTAHHLVTGDNPVGRAVIEELDWTDPEAPCV